jgi:hypothetical protein
MGADGFDGADFLCGRINERGNAVGCHDRIRMFIECDNERDAFVLLRVGDSLPDDLLMSEMNPVKNADSEANLAVTRLKFVGSANDFHSTTDKKG